MPDRQLRPRPCVPARVGVAALLGTATLFAVGALAAPAPSGPAGAAPIAQPDPNPTDAIVFADGAPAIDLFSILPDGTGRRSLTGGAGVPSEKYAERLPDWSPDGAQVAYVASRSDGPVRAEAAIWVLANDAAGSPIRVPMTFGPYDTDPDWSPDGTRIVYASVLEQGNPGQISSINIVTPGSADQQLVLTPLASPYAVIEQPRWSPDGRQILFVVRVDSPQADPSRPNEGGELYVVNADGSGARRLLARPGWYDGNPAWSPDGRTIAWDSYHIPPTVAIVGGIWLLDVATGRAGVVVPYDDGFPTRRPKWSPDGRQLVVEGPVTGDEETRRIHILDIAAPTPRAALTTGREPDWARRPLLPTPTPIPTTGGPTPTDGPSPVTTPTPSPSAEPATPTPPPVPGLTPFPTLNPFPTLPPREPTLPPFAPTWPRPSATPTPSPAPTATPSATATSAATATATATTASGGRIFLPISLSAFPLGDPAATPTPDGAPTATLAATAVSSNRRREVAAR